jgi:uroporphyrinogen decarboxylase
MIRNDLFLRACRREPVERTPVWMMRQAGRYLPEYRAVRARSDFLTMCKTPELATEVTIQPVDLVGVDAAIIFSDILVIPEAMGMRLEMIEAQGPRLHDPVRTRAAVEALRVPEPDTRLRFVMDALAMTRRTLAGRVPLIGFSGAPWTLAAYMVEGAGTKEFSHIKRMMLDEPATLHLLLGRLAESVRLYLDAQIAAGADAVQIFDTWAGVLSPAHFREFSLPYIGEIVSRLERRGVPVIVFAKGANHALRELAGTGAGVIGLDWTVEMGEARALIGDRVALQGNLDPGVLRASPAAIRREVQRVLASFGQGTGHIFNLGHGITPDIPVPHARALIDAVTTESPAFHV